MHLAHRLGRPLPLLEALAERLGDLHSEERGRDYSYLLLRTQTPPGALMPAGSPMNEVGANLRFRRDQYLGPEPTDELDLREGAWSCRRGPWLASVGRQFAVWGKADGFPVLDIVHPFDLTEFALDGLRHSQRSLTMIRLERTLSDEDFLQFLAIPERRSDRLPGVQGRFAPAFPQTVYNSLARSNDGPPAWGVQSTQFGLKWEHSGSALGYTLNLLNQWAPQPHYEWDNAVGAIVSRLNRRWVAGGSFDYAFEDWVIRGEAAYMDELWLDRKPLPGSMPALVPDYAPYRQLNWMLGVDRNLGGWLIGLQFFDALNFGNEREPIVGSENRLATLLATKSFFQDRLKLRAFVARDLGQQGSWVELEASYNLRKNLMLTLGADLLSGDQSSAFGRVSDQDRIAALVTIGF